MRAWGSRADTRVIDEPFYGHYLQVTGYDHPGADEVIRHHETDWRKIARRLVKNGKSEPIVYQKHMTQHMLAHIDRNWLKQVSNCFLLREPRRMLLSFVKVIPEPRLDQTGLPQQVELFNAVRELTGKTPPVIEARHVLQQPERTLRRLCAVLDLPFDRAMLSWAPGPRTSDGVWAKHWYAAVERSSGFAPYQEDDTPVPPRLRGLLDECDALYQQMAPYCISGDDE